MNKTVINRILQSRQKLTGRLDCGFGEVPGKQNFTDTA